MSVFRSKREIMIAVAWPDVDKAEGQHMVGTRRRSS